MEEGCIMLQQPASIVQVCQRDIPREVNGWFFELRLSEMRTECSICGREKLIYFALFC
jgi:hypothetical protein